MRVVLQLLHCCKDNCRNIHVSWKGHFALAGGLVKTMYRIRIYMGKLEREHRKINNSNLIKPIPFCIVPSSTASTSSTVDPAASNANSWVDG